MPKEALGVKVFLVLTSCSLPATSSSMFGRSLQTRTRALGGFVCFLSNVSIIIIYLISVSIIHYTNLLLV